MKEKRFLCKGYEGGIIQQFMIIVDEETGVNYLFVRSGYSGGLTPLLDENGNVVISK